MCCYEFIYEISQLYDNILHLKFCYWGKVFNFIKWKSVHTTRDGT